ncbi:transmembrane protein 93-like protein [Blakeslea trispora]|nr:transmembrane protein 93-like protein [Blakeslea trispora]
MNASPPAPGQDAHKYIQPHVMHNARQLQFIRSCFAAIAGSAAGILGLSNLFGFLFYAMSWVVLSALLLIKTGGSKTYFVHGYRDVVLDGALGGLLSYILFHTLLYGLVHLYQ